MDTEQLRRAEYDYIFHDKLLPEISQEIEISQEEIAQYQEAWEFRRQAFRVAEFFYCQEGRTLQEIIKLTPLTLSDLTAHEPVMQQKRKAYLAATPSAFLQVHHTLEERVEAITSRPTPLIPIETIGKFYDTLKPHATIIDHYELILNLIVLNFLPTKHFGQTTQDQLITLLEEFRGFLKLQLLGGNR